MLLVLLVMVLAALAVLLTGGRFARLADLSMSGLRWLAAAALIQVLGSLIGGLFGFVYPLGLLASAACIGVFLRRNLHHPGVGLLALGFVCNAMVVVLNGAMPVSLAALTRAGLEPDPGDVAADPRHEVSGDGTLLPWLGDVIPVALPNLGQAVSAGDVLVAAGAGLLLFAGMRRTSEAEAAADHATQ